MLAPERNREHSIEDQVMTLNVGIMERLQLYSVVEIAKANGQESYTWLRHALERLLTASSIEDYEALLPWNCSPTSPR
ncbi:hypothetical protein D3C77_276450 [compost metagenome]